MIRLRLLADRLFASTTAVMFTGAMAFLGSLYLVAPFRQGGLGLSVLNAGLSTFPEALGGRPSSSSAPPFHFFVRYHRSEAGRCGGRLLAAAQTADHRYHGGF